jgi:hypothetical protein
MEVRVLFPTSATPSIHIPSTYEVVEDFFPCAGNPSLTFVPAVTGKHYLWVTSTTFGDAFAAEYTPVGP